MIRATRGAYWLAPIALCLALYWFGLKTWFEQDDFAWLNLRNHVVDFHSFLWAMFSPLAQGTVRPWSERGFFMLFSSLFHLHALPYHVFVFFNQFVNIALLGMVTLRLTKSEIAGFAAPVLWICNLVMVTPMAWVSAYNEIQCATFLLLSFYLFLRYTETGRKGFYWAQWVTFLLGFGANEINVVYPALVALYAILLARRYWLSTLPMFVASAGYVLLHGLSVSSEASFYYDMDFRARSLIRTLQYYWRLMLAFSTYADSRQWHRWTANLAVIVLTLTLLGFGAWQARRRRFLPLFCLGWFGIALAPLLPLHNHLTDYYLFIPTLGIAMLAGNAIGTAWRTPWVRPAAIGLALLYAVPSGLIVHRNMKVLFERMDRARLLVESVAYAKHIHPGKLILLDNVDDELFWSTIYGSPFHIFGWNDVFLTPECAPLIKPDPHLGRVDPYVLPASAAAQALDQGALVYAVENRKLRNITRTYTAVLRSKPAPPLASLVQLGTPYFDSQLGDGWYQVETGYRWSSGHAIVYLPGPTAPGQKLSVHGLATEQETKLGPLHFALTIDGHPQPVHEITAKNADFTFEYVLPADLIGRRKIEVAFTLDRVLRIPTDTRDLGLVFGEFGVQ
ncbi:MAG TPA: hypothetical protein VKX49_04980 [Bryobacteraceae bacterium]|nr:hypothetical protein [Bryobacteraceae bacterium]